MKRKLIGIVLAFCMLIGCAPCMVHAVWVGDLWINYEVHDDPAASSYATLDGCKEDVESLFVPSTVNGVPITHSSLGGVGEGCENLTTVTISEGLKEIGCGSFSNCPKLKTVNLPSTLTTVEVGAFVNCPLLESIIIPKDTSYVYSSAFSGCEKLKISVDSRNPYFKVKNGVLFHSADGVTTLVKYMPSNTNKSYSMPEGVDQFESEAFNNKYLENCSISNGIKTIPYYAFPGCTALKTVTIPSTVNTIWWNSFSKTLTDIYYEGYEEEWNNIHVKWYDELGECEKPISNLPSYLNFLSGVTVHFAEPPREPCFTVSGSRVTNTADTEQTATIITATYNGKRLTDVTSREVTFKANEAKTFTVPTGGKLFVWDSVSGMRPLTK